MANWVATPATKKDAMISPMIDGVPPRCSRNKGSRGSPNVAPIHWRATMTVRRRSVWRGDVRGTMRG